MRKSNSNQERLELWVDLDVCHCSYLDVVSQLPDSHTNVYDVDIGSISELRCEQLGCTPPGAKAAQSCWPQLCAADS